MTLYAPTIGLSAFLLFQVQPLIAKIILPWFGGAAAVWSAAMLFFQLGVLAGYAYAHCLTRYLRARAQMAVHVTLLVASCALLPIIPSPAWKMADMGDPTLRILTLLVSTLGLPYALLSATSPLLQAWYARRPGPAVPYRLFALSNIGAMLGLVSFPFLIEPHLTSHQQAVGWSGAYVLFALLCAVAAWGTQWDGASESSPAMAARVTSPRPPVVQILLWVSLSACASTLLISVTNHLSQNIAPLPLLWVGPLAIYLTTFVLSFESDRVYRRGIFLGLLVPALGVMAYLMYANLGNPPIQLMIPVFACGLFVCCMVCHGELAHRKPVASTLTLFYLMMSLGGALGGLFVVAVAPRVFHSYLELPIGLVACASLASLVVWNVQLPVLGRRALRPALVLGVVLLAASLARQEYLAARPFRTIVRNFYGVLRVHEENYPHERVLTNGTIRHGAQLLDAGERDRATAYYGPTSGVGQALRALQARGPVRVGVVGLGAGVLASYGRPGDVYRFYEINPLVDRIAQTEFTFYAHSQADKRILLGDARLVLERQENQRFDLLAVDAFSSDAIPIHLLTREALAVYFAHLKPDGILAVHVTNRYLNLVPVIARGAQSFHTQAMVVRDDGHEAAYLSASTWVLLSSEGKWFMSPSFETSQMTQAAAPPGFRAWTDDYSSLYSVIEWDPRSAVTGEAKNWVIVPGRSVGPVKLDSDIRDVAAVLGPEVTIGRLPDGGSLHHWFAPPASAGFGADSTDTGKVFLIWIQNDARYATKERLHVGSTLAEVRGALGPPTRVIVNQQRTIETLWYDPQGVWFNVSLDPQRAFYNAVYSIGVIGPK